ncbi:MAG: peptide chain release factor N(5)-glutamine methyltransferase [Lentisphaerae bacterium]|jgi:release factor glutamine methyltransferase|nr:peptide chain release factor N(5)-glutamine methyltransferase [Lentisphaerota bacterium]
MNIEQLIDSLRFRFGASGVDNARRVAEELVAHLLNCKPLEIYTKRDIQPKNQTEQLRLIKQIEPLAKRIENGEPLQYVVGHVDFFGLQIKCDRRALIPRPETELLVDEVLCSSIWKHKPTSVIDVGTGSGCIALTLAKQRPDANVSAVDLSAEALELAQENAQLNDLQGRVLWLENDLLQGVAEGSADAVVANLPYISSIDYQMLSPSVRDHEPQTALESAPTGMELIQQLAEQARYVLLPGGMLFLEFGHNQGALVRECLEKLGYRNVQIKHDLAGHERMAIAVNP